MFEISNGIVLRTSILEFLPECWRALPTPEEFYGIDWREVPISTIYADLSHHSYEEKFHYNCENRSGQATRISEPNWERQELWGAAKTKIPTTPLQWTHNRGVLGSRCYEGLVQPAVRNSYLGVFMRNGIIHNDYSQRAVKSLADDYRGIVLPLAPVGTMRMTLNCRAYSEHWIDGVHKSVIAENAYVVFYDTHGVRFRRYIPRDDMDWSGFYFSPNAEYPNATDKMIFLSKLRELTEKPKAVMFL